MDRDIVLDNLMYAYPPLTPEQPSVPVLRGISLSIQPGEKAILLGRTGAGKSTLLLSTIGIVPQRTGGTFRGRVVVCGHDTRHIPVPDLATCVGYLFQDPDAQVFQVRVEDEVAFALENLGLSEEEIGRRVDWALQVVGLSHLRDRSPAHLSGGQKQRLALAAVLAMQPRILVLDEPTANLDPIGRDNLLALLAGLSQEGHTIFLATQEVDWAVELADSAHALHDGTLALSGQVADVFTRVDRLTAATVPLPQMVELRGRLAAHDLTLPPFLTLEQAQSVLASYLPPSSPAVPQPSFPSSDLQPSALHLPPVSAPDIHVADVHFTYPNGVGALQGLSLHIEGGEFVALVGPNGAGKSTLARHLNGLLRPARGRVLVGHLDTREEPVPRLARLVGYVFQNPDHQLFAPTVEEEIAFAPRNLGLPLSEVKARVQEALELFNLQDVAHIPPAVLGFGLRRKVALAAVFAARPSVLILDEPTTGLDALSAREVMSLVAAFHRAGHTILLITHDMRLVAEWAPRTVVMHKGRVLYDGPTRTLFQQEEVLRLAHLTPPPITRLAQSLARFGFPPDVLTVDEFVRTFVQGVQVP